MSYPKASIFIILCQHVLLFSCFFYFHELRKHLVTASMLMALSGMLWKYYCQYYDYFEKGFLIKGPFRHMRYPNIFGDIIIILAVVVLCPWYTISMAFLVVSLILLKIKYDILEKNRIDAYGNLYKEYAFSTPGFLPSFIPFHNKGNDQFVDKISIQEILSLKNRRAFFQSVLLLGFVLSYIGIALDLRDALYWYIVAGVYGIVTTKICLDILQINILPRRIKH